MKEEHAARVLCLYRVSTKQQLDENDIPMQRKECRSFCQKKGWHLCREIVEKGVSGYSVNLEDREAIKQIKEATLQHEFEVFLVYMFDRIGRKEFEVPAFLRFLVENGISVWSTQEGEQRFENDADSILAMLRSFTAQRESMKISTRIHTKHMQMVMAGEYRGGNVPFGYKTRETSKMNRKGIPVKELYIDEACAAIVKMIFEKRVYEKKGIYEISQMLSKMSNPLENMPNWRASTINSLLSNRIYIGQMKFDGKYSMPFEHLRIISNDLFFAAQSVKRCKHTKQRKKIELPEFYDVLYCAHCKGHLIFNAVHSKNGNENIKTRLVYRCYNKLKYSSPCVGQSTYSKESVDQLVIDEVQKVLQILFNANEDALIANAVEQEHRQTCSRIEELNKNIEEQKNSIQFLQDQMISVTKQYGVEASSGLQIIITDKLADLSTLKELLSVEKKKNIHRETLRNKFRMELHRIKSEYLGYEQWSTDHYLQVVPFILLRIEVESGYVIHPQYTPQIKNYLS